MSYRLEHRTHLSLSAGRPYPLGGTPRDGGVNFALYSRHAEQVFLLLFDEPASPPTDIIQLTQRTRHIWHGFVEGIAPGQLYGYKVCGRNDPAHGFRFNPHKLLIDPYAKALTSKLRDLDLLLGFDKSSPSLDMSLDRRDNDHVVPKGIVRDDAFDWQGDAPPRIRFQDLVIYEAHLRGFTAHPSSGVAHPGTYLGFIEKIPHLQSLGVNAVELLPVHAFASERFLRDKGLHNYWGYNTVSYFAPERSYASGSRLGCEVDEWKTLVRALHRAGIEVIIDVVYNHTAEGSELGPTFSLRGIDNPTYYCLTGSPTEPKRHYRNYSGCGNSLQLSHPAVIRLVMDSLRYWVQEMHVDGFRFDLASVLGREEGKFDTSASFFDVVAQDPVLCRVKLIAEPWDVETYEVGNFPVDWAEWNARFRDTMRRFARGDSDLLPDVGYRLTGSSDLYDGDGRCPYHSVNFVTCHDGFTLRDLVSYEHKHNEANLENNRDGAPENHSFHCGVEGETSDPNVLGMRQRIAKNHICHLLFSLGTPMLLGGDEVLHTQHGNNNAYCQDNETTWMDWRRVEENAAFLTFVRRAIALRKRHPILRRGRFHAGTDTDGDAIPDIAWYGADLESPWDDPRGCTICYQLDGKEAGRDAPPCLLYFILNAAPSLEHVRLPPPPAGARWHRVVDTSLAGGEDFMAPGEEVLLEPGDYYIANSRSTVVLVSKPLHV